MKTTWSLWCCGIVSLFFLFSTNHDVRSAEPLRFYVGTYTSQDGSKGIYTGTFDAAQGTLSEPQLAVETVNPAFLAVHPSKPYLYAVGESQKGMLRAFLRHPKTGMLLPHDEKEVPGSGPCHLALCPSEHGETDAVVVANYGSGNVVSFTLSGNGKIAKVAADIQHVGSGPNKGRQKGPHAHGVYFNAVEDSIAVPDLGIDQTIYYRIDPVTAELTRSLDLATLVSNPGAGPRHLAVGGGERFVYVVNELDSTVSVFDRKTPKSPELTQTISTLPEGTDAATLKNSTAEIQLHPNGKFLYASNRGHDSIAVFAINKGELKLIQNAPSGGKTPRFFCLDPSGRFLLTCHQDSGDICVLAVNPEAGTLQPTDQKINVAKPVCLVFVEP